MSYHDARLSTLPPPTIRDPCKITGCSLMKMAIFEIRTSVNVKVHLF